MKNKKLLLICLSIVLIIVAVGIIIIQNNNNDNSQEKISKISINDIKMNTKATKEMMNLVMDADFPYEYNHVGFNVDENDYINRIEFYTSTSGDETYGINEVNVQYENKSLKTVEDFNNLLGTGKEEVLNDNPSYKHIKYTEKNYELVLTIHDDIIINIVIKKR